MRNVRRGALLAVDPASAGVDYGSMLFRVLERYAPSRLLTALIAAAGTVIFGLKFGATFLLAVAALEIGLWLDNYGQR